MKTWGSAETLPIRFDPGWSGWANAGDNNDSVLPRPGTCLTLNVLSGLPLWPTTGFVVGLVRLGPGGAGLQDPVPPSANIRREPAISRRNQPE
ncbi:MAG: hypothetical protein GDA36_06505 [Rhodobacteraceae bacterium]|nr:hypothetical protein [Paracoccaceae bacterium]